MDLHTGGFWTNAITVAFVAALGATIIFFFLGEILSSLIYRYQKGIYSRFQFFSNLDQLSTRQKAEIQTYGTVDGVTIHKVLFTFTLGGVTHRDTEVGYITTDDHAHDTFDGPFNKFMVKTLLMRSRNVEEGEFALADLTMSDMTSINRALKVSYSEQNQDVHTFEMRNTLERDITEYPKESYLSDIRRSNILSTI